MAVERQARPHELEAVLGRTLAETQLLNSPAHRAGREANAALRRCHSADAMQLARNPRRFRRAALLLIAALAAAGGLTWLVSS